LIDKRLSSVREAQPEINSAKINARVVRNAKASLALLRQTLGEMLRFDAAGKTCGIRL
jgi:hypothetical protein